MGSPIRITGMNSGLDTESIIKALTQNQQDKVTKLEGEQKRLTWKQDKWKELNKKVSDLYNGTLASMRFTDAFSKKTTTVSRASAVTVVTGENAMNTTQKMKVTSLASNAYMTGAKLSTKSGGKVTGNTKLSDLAGANFTTHEETVDLQADTYKAKTKDGEQLFLKLNDAGTDFATDEEGKPIYLTQSEMDAEIAAAAAEEPSRDISANYLKAYQKVDVSGGSPVYKDIADEDLMSELGGIKADESLLEGKTDYQQTKTVQDKQSFTLKFGGDTNEKTIQVDANTTVNDLVNKLRGLKSGKNDGLNVNFDEAQGRIYIASNRSGASAGFTLGGLEGALGAAIGLDDSLDDAKYEAGSDAKITLNGVEYTSNSNNFNINGLTLTVNETTGNDEITLTTKSDTSGTYDMIKKFVKEYSELINEMDKLYHADGAKNYKMLTEDEKEAMKDDEVEAWEEKIKDGLLSRDRTLGDVSSAIKDVMTSTFNVKNGAGESLNIGLSYFGINTLSYFEAKENEKYALYIDGDKDSENYNVKAAEDKLNKLITNDPDLVTNFFTTLSKQLYGKLHNLMQRSEFSSSFTLYEDIVMNKQYSSYNDKIADANEKLTAMEDKYYKKFGKMESALGTINSTQSALAGYFGGGSY